MQGSLKADFASLQDCTFAKFKRVYEKRKQR